MRLRHGITLAVIITCALAGGCTPQEPDRKNSPPPGIVVTDNVATGEDRTVTLRVEQPAASAKPELDPSDRCWHLSELDLNGQILNTVSACGARTKDSASMILGAVLVRSDCVASPTVKAGGNAQSMFLTVNAVYGIFIVPANVFPPNVSSLTYACVDNQGLTGEPKKVLISR